MPIFLDTRGRRLLAIGICDRCHTKVPLDTLVPDGNMPGLRVCQDLGRGCWDPVDPWKLSGPRPDVIALQFARPDVPLDPEPMLLGTEQDPNVVLGGAENEDDLAS